MMQDTDRKTRDSMTGPSLFFIYGICNTDLQILVKRETIQVASSMEKMKAFKLPTENSNQSQGRSWSTDGHSLVTIGQCTTVSCVHVHLLKTSEEAKISQGSFRKNTVSV